MTQLFLTASLAFVTDGRLLTVRKQGTDRFMLPGGKIEAGESALACAVREAEEEIGVRVAADDVDLLGHWRAAAANEPGAVVDSVVHLSRVPAVDPVARAEIAELRWLDLDAAPAADLAPLLLDHVLPALRDHPSATMEA